MGSLYMYIHNSIQIVFVSSQWYEEIVFKVTKHLEDNTK